MSNVQPRYTIVRRGKLVTFFKNGDPFFKGLQTSVSGKHFVTLSTLLSWLNDKIPLISGIKYIFRLPDGLEISDVTQFEAGRSYVVSNVKKLNLSIKYGDPFAKYPRIFDQQSGDDLYIDKGFYKSPLPGNGASFLRPRDSNHYSSDPDFGRRRANKENILAMLNNQQNTPSTLDLQDEVNDSPKDAPGFRRRSFVFKSSVDAESLNMKRCEDSYDELNESALTSPSQTQKYSEYESAKEDMRDLREKRRRSKAASLGSSAESSGSGSDKLSALDQPRNKTFLPLDAKRHERFMKKSNRLPKLNPSTSRTSSYDRHAGSSKEELDSLFKYSRHHPSFPRIHNTIEPPKGAPYTANSFPRSAEELTRSPTGKIWSPISLKDNFQRNVKPRIIQITSNLDRNSCQRVIFNPRTLQSFEEVMKDLESMLSVPYPPVTAIYTADEPFVKVLSLSHLTGELRHCEDFLVCGKEGVPMEIHPNFSTNIDNRSNISTALKGARSEERLDSDSSRSFDQPNIRKRIQHTGHSEPSLERRLKPVNLYLNKKPINNDIQITVGCQSQNCGCRLHETLSQLLNNNNNNNNELNPI